MDRKAIIVLSVSFLLLVLWFPLVQRLYPPAPVTDTTPAEAARPDDGAPAADIARPPAQTVAAPALQGRASDAPEQTLTLENELAIYTFTSHGGGLKHVDLKKYPAMVARPSGDGAAADQPARLNARAPVPVLGIDASWAQGDRGYVLARSGANTVRAERELADGLRIIKEFQLGEDYLVHASLTFTNTSDKPAAVGNHELILGTASPAGPKDDPAMMGLFVYDGSKKTHQQAAWFDNRTFGCGPANPRDQYETGERPVVWVAAENQSFALAAIPRVPGRELISRRVELLPSGTTAPINGKATQTTHGFQNGIPYNGSVIDPHASLTREFDLYAGPKELKTLSRLSAQLKNNLDLIMDLDGFFGFFSKLLLFAMNALHGVGLSYGWAIVAITVAIKLLFWPLTKASTRSMKRMQALQPQMKALQERYKDDPQKLNQKMMEMWKEHKINPLGGCLPMLIQMPVFFGFFFMIRTAIELRGAEFLWIYDLSTPDTVFSIPGVNFPINPMAFLMAVTMVFQMRMTPAAPGMDPMQAKMMKWMPLMFVVFLYNFSSGLTLYWTVQNVLSIIQTKMTQSEDKKDTTKPAVASPASSPKKQKRH